VSSIFLAVQSTNKQEPDGSGGSYPGMMFIFTSLLSTYFARMGDKYQHIILLAAGI